MRFLRRKEDMKNQMIDSELLQKLKDKWVILDTNFILNASRYPNKYNLVLEELKSVNIEITSLNFILLEIYKGSDIRAHFTEKKELIDDLIDAILPINSLHENANLILFAYRKKAQHLSITDLYIASALKTYSKELFLITENLKDFPGDLFTWNGYINVPKISELNTYGIVSYNEELYQKAMNDLNKAGKLKSKVV